MAEAFTPAIVGGDLATVRVNDEGTSVVAFGALLMDQCIDSERDARHRPVAHHHLES